MCVPSMTESCFCGFAPKQDVDLYHFTESYGRNKLRHGIPAARPSPIPAAGRAIFFMVPREPEKEEDDK